ncbi:MAG: hypothetical protein AABO58_00780 [Acidobacteriota bacterium]
MNDKIVIWHGEARSLFYVVDADAPDEEQPAVERTASSPEEAVAVINALHAGTTRTVSANDAPSASSS